MEEEITITLKEYNRLQDDSRFLEFLEGCGVDSWDGYDEAVSQWQSEKDEEGE